ncbi:NADH dehydrogenase (ubiquinone) complex I, assembly factor 6-like isoform X1 [Trichoplusia ni]|uniref:15-cis-phytoene synthase n=2 Tax=Trichoplusia ni TaxID=7111 RepID=A0A7E5VFJ8_TRINI|nr:NADH dehydrogenase (ubiquinone) complex I, assembly factor 6-like isoform X1 [Trichoplusia ni]
MNKHSKFFHILKPLKHIGMVTRQQSNEAMCNETAIEYCANIVKQYDYENFMATLLMTKSVRSPALVLRAFNVEIARVQDQTSDAQTAAFRLQFWHDTVKTIYQKEQNILNVPANPIAQELFKVCVCYGLQKRQLEKLILSRSNLLNSKHFKTLEDIEKYAEDSVSPIYYLLLDILGVANVNADHAASHLGKAQGITNILRSVRISNYHKMVTLPMDILMKYSVSQEDVLRCIDSENMRNVAYEVASRANSHLQKARSIEVPTISKQIFLPAIAIDQFLSKLQKVHFNLFDNALHVNTPTLPFRLYYNRVIKKF